MAVNYANEYYPLPNQPDGRFIELRGLPTDSNQLTLKGDHNFNSEHRASFRYYHNKDTNGAFRGGVSAGLIGASFSVVNSYTAATTHNLSPTSLGEFRVSYTTVVAESTSPYRALSPRDLGGNFNVDGDNTATPDVNIAGRGFAAASFPARRPDKTLQIGGKVSWIKGRHALKVGAETYQLIGGETAQWRSAGVFTFNGNFTELSAADYMLGRPSNLRAQSTIHNDTFTENYHIFVQDDFKVSTRLTLNLGLRYEVQPPWAQKFDFQSTIRPHAPCFGNCQQSQVFPEAAPGTVYPGDTGVARGLVDTDLNNFAPRGRPGVGRVRKRKDLGTRCVRDVLRLYRIQPIGRCRTRASHSCCPSSSRLRPASVIRGASRPTRSPIRRIRSTTQTQYVSTPSALTSATHTCSSGISTSSSS